MMSPTKNPCRIRCTALSATSPSAMAPISWYRYDPYMSKVLPSPMKTMPSPKQEAATRVNSLFANAPALNVPDQLDRVTRFIHSVV